MQYTIYVYDKCTSYYVINRYPVCDLVTKSAAPRSRWMNDAKCVRVPPKTAELLPSCRQRPRWGSQRTGLTAQCNPSKPPEYRKVFLTVPAGRLLVSPLRFVLMRKKPTKEVAFLLSISVTPFKFNLLLAAESVLNSFKWSGHYSKLQNTILVILCTCFHFISFCSIRFVSLVAV